MLQAVAKIATKDATNVQVPGIVELSDATILAPAIVVPPEAPPAPELAVPPAPAPQTNVVDAKSSPSIEEFVGDAGGDAGDRFP
ncbi:unnamed protein product, partial [Ilex paraguariensis]